MPHAADLKEQLRQNISKILVPSYGLDDPILECGSAPLAILQDRPSDVLSIAHERLHAFPYKDVPECWRRLYTEASLWQILKLEDVNWITEVVKLLDMAIILTGAPRRYEAIQSLLHSLEAFVYPDDGEDVEMTRGALRDDSTKSDGARKRRKIEESIPKSFPGDAELPVELSRPINEVELSTLPAFEAHIRRDHRSNNHGPLPFIITGALAYWPAVSDQHRVWSNPRHLLGRTLDGRRLVPIELGRSYTDEDWGQQIMTFGQFLTSHMLQDPQRAAADRKTGYLAQHDLFVQIPGLRADIAVPDFCYATVPEPRSEPAVDDVAVQEASDTRSDSNEDESDGEVNRDVMLNAWFGPAHTVSPLHTDPHHNILAQVVGSKYVRLYAPAETVNLYPRAKEGEIDMSNTSQVDVDVAMRVFEGRNLEPASKDQDAEAAAGRFEHEGVAFAARFPRFRDAEYVEGVLGPGECLFIPRGWWHYVRSLSASCSVSFWWD